MTSPAAVRRRPVLFWVGIAVLVAAVAAGAVWAANRGPRTVDLTSLDVVTLQPDPQVALAHPITVPRADQGCPAFSVDAPVAPRGAVTGQGAWFMLDPEGGRSIVLTCLGPVEETGRIGEVVGAVPLEDEASILYGQPVWVRSPYGEALRTETRFTSTGTTLTEWFTERDGHLYGVGLLQDADGTSALPTVEAMLTTWRWS